MQIQQRKPPRQRRAAVPAAPRQVYTAAVRFRDGSRDIFHVLNANDLDDARDLVLAELSNIRSLLIAPRQ